MSDLTPGTYFTRLVQINANALSHVPHAIGYGWLPEWWEKYKPAAAALAWYPCWLALRWGSYAAVWCLSWVRRDVADW